MSNSYWLQKMKEVERNNPETDWETINNRLEIAKNVALALLAITAITSISLKEKQNGSHSGKSDI